jgi:hypothetical protein
LYPYPYSFAGHTFIIINNYWAYDPTFNIWVPRDYTFGYWDGHTVYKLDDSHGIDISTGELVTAQTTDHSVLRHCVELGAGAAGGGAAAGAAAGLATGGALSGPGAAVGGAAGFLGGCGGSALADLFG